MTTLDTPAVYFKIIDDILQADYKPGRVDLKEAEQIVRNRLEFQKYHPMLVLVSGQDGVKFDKNARDYLASEKGTDGITAAAILLTSPITTVIGNFIMLVNRPKIPVKVFVNKKDAIAWLKNHAK